MTARSSAITDGANSLLEVTGIGFAKLTICHCMQMVKVPLPVTSIGRQGEALPHRDWLRIHRLEVRR